jgi:hypothetical protein
MPRKEHIADATLGGRVTHNHCIDAMAGLHLVDDAVFIVHHNALGTFALDPLLVYLLHLVD